MLRTLLDTTLLSQIYAWALVFARIGTTFSIMPTLGEPYISTRVRLLLALAITVVVTPSVRRYLPDVPTSGLGVAVLLMAEMLVGVFLGTVMKIMMSALEVAGMIIAMQSSLANAFVFNPAAASQGSLPGAMMGALGVALLFATNMHHFLILAAVDSYTIFTPGATVPVDDLARTITDLTSSAFLIGVQMSAPFLVTGFLFSLALGLIARLMPQIQVFFIFMSAQVGLGLLLFMITLSAMMLFWLRSFESLIYNMLNPV